MKTRRDAYIELKEKHGITTSAMFHGNLEEEISDETYDLIIKLSLSVFDDLDDDDDDDL